jgi:hypothetical protein
MASPAGCATICASSPDPFFEVRQQAAALKEDLGTNRAANNKFWAVGRQTRSNSVTSCLPVIRSGRSYSDVQPNIPNE